MGALCPPRGVFVGEPVIRHLYSSPFEFPRTRVSMVTADGWVNHYFSIPVSKCQKTENAVYLSWVLWKLPGIICIKRLKVRYVLVIQLSPTLCDPMDCSLPGSSVHGISQVRTLEWVAISFNFLTQGLNLGVLHCRQIPYHLSHQGSVLNKFIDRACLPIIIIPSDIKPHPNL